MDHTAGPILEIGLLLLGAVVAGWLARRVGLPAVVGYLGLGVVVSPFTPDHAAGPPAGPSQWVNKSQPS